MIPRYRDYASYLKRFFPYKVQKITINAGFTCPNRDGNKGQGGCTYCNNQTFNPAYCLPTKTISQQIEEGITFFSSKYPDMRYLAYFQAYTNTYADLDSLRSMYEEALRYPQVIGIIIGTRPDCMPTDLLQYLKELSQHYYVMIEYGVESTLDTTLQYINRGHTYQESIDAITKTAAAGLQTGAHLILGLPGESRNQMLGHATALAQLPLSTLKLHQLQLVRHTRMAAQYEADPTQFNFFTLPQYIDFVIDFIQLIPPHISIERFASQSPSELLIAPHWGVKNNEFTNKVLKRMEERNAYQGELVR